eukprot:TRINITY_DN11771_c0_g1_i1.p3 TRINITY_DN11771_c0_g1~~TRINITY_DN11771_c0_g1_i1.p3  ORF type:complete len:105 (-),score=3.44 TRINITY_DN11771_c0_g1_i1:89-403(-)
MMILWPLVQLERYKNLDIIKAIRQKQFQLLEQMQRQRLKSLLKKGYMLGSVYQRSEDYAEALYISGMNMLAGKSPIEGTQYTFDNTFVSIRIPHKDYLYNNIFI